MAAPRSVIGETMAGGGGGGGVRITIRDEEEEEKKANVDEDSPSAKRPKLERLKLSKMEIGAFGGVFLVFSAIFLCMYTTLPPSSDVSHLRFPRNLSDLRSLKEHLGSFASDYPVRFVFGYCSIYIFMQTFMIPGTLFLSLLAGATFGVFRGLLLIVFNATAGASCCFFLSKMIGRPIVSWLWPDKLRLFQGEIAKRRDKLMNYMLFLRITPSLPNLFINLASPIVDVPFHTFFFGTLIGLVPASFITAKAGLALGDLKSVKDLYDFKTLFVLFLIGCLIILPTLLKRKRIYE